jgi:hypothetical protein
VSRRISTRNFAEEMVTITADTQTQGSVDVHVLTARCEAADRLLDPVRPVREQLEP